jgi:hypothetical protein
VRLVSAVLGFVLRKAGALVAVVLSLFLGYLLVQAAVPAVKEAVTDRARLQQVVAERAALEADLEQRRDEAISSLTSTTDARIEAVSTEVAAARSAVESRQGDICSRLESVP